MKDIKKFLIAALSFMLLVSISCSNDNKTGSGGTGGKEDSGGSGEETTYNVIGIWHGDDDGSGTPRKIIEIKDGFSSVVYYKDASDTTGITIAADSITDNGDYSYTADITGVGKATLTFTSDTEGTLKIDSKPEITITKQ